MNARPAPERGTPALRCTGLRKSFGGVIALADVTIDFPAAGVVAIIGPNGAGKTTLINGISGFLRLDAGRCYVGGREITRLRPYQIVRLGLVRSFQDIRLIQQESVLDNVMLARPRQRGEALLWTLWPMAGKAEEVLNAAAARDELRFVGLEGEASSVASELSYGQQKLLALACCLATGSEIFVLDEPVAGVHPDMITHILELLRRLKDDGKLVIFVEHNIDAVRQVADRVIVLDEGKVIADGDPATVLARPEILHAYVS